MEGNSLFNPGFLGGNFNWWIGKIPDDSTWRENIIPRGYRSVDDNSGWGYRYKVRIIGIHDLGEKSIPSSDLPWAQVMYPVTAGGGQGSAFATPALRQGNMVFGFFMDQQEQQIPVIMGVLGSNSVIPKSKNQNNESYNNESTATSGDSNRTKPLSNPDEKKVPDNNINTQQSNGQSQVEGTDGFTLKTAQDDKVDDEQKRQWPFLNPHDVPGSAMSAIQTTLDKLITYIDGWLSTITSYTSAVSSIISSIQDMEGLIKRLACEIAKYMKIIMDKVMEYTLKVLNKTLAPIVSSIPSTMRYMFGNIKEIITELILCLYNKMTSGMCEMLASLLLDTFDLKSLEEEARKSEEGDRTLPEVPVCYAEDLVGKVIAANKQNIEDANNSILDNINAFVSDIQEELAGLTDDFADILSLPGDIMGSIGSALSFNNLVLNILGCELSPQWTSAQFWSIAHGGSSHSDSQQSSPQSVAEQANTPFTGSAGSEVQWIQPPPGTEDQLLGTS